MKLAFLCRDRLRSFEHRPTYLQRPLTFDRSIAFEGVLKHHKLKDAEGTAFERTGTVTAQIRYRIHLIASVEFFFRILDHF